MSYDYNSLVQKIHSFRVQAEEFRTGRYPITLDAQQKQQLETKKDNTHDDDDEDDEDDKKGDEKRIPPSKIEVLQGAVDAFMELSGHCPMTPLLWVKYGSTIFQYCQELASAAVEEGNEHNEESNSMETEIQILQLGLHQFPGSLLMHLRYIHVLQQRQKILSDELGQQQQQLFRSALEQAIVQVGRGSYTRFEAPIIVAQLYHPLAELYASEKKSQELFDLLVMNQARRPFPNNYEIISFYQELCQKYSLEMPEESEKLVEQGRRLVAKLYDGQLQIEQYDTDVEALLHAQHLLPPYALLQQNEDDDDESSDQKFWNMVLSEGSSYQFGMGLGGYDLAERFLAMARALVQFQIKDNHLEESSEEIMKNMEQMTADIHSLSTAVYERGVAECPTAEMLWTSYMDHVEGVVEGFYKEEGSSKGDSPLPQLLMISQRAFRNCPYSLILAQRQLHLQGFLAEHKIDVLDPDKLLSEIVQPALATKFLPPNATATLYLTALRIIQQRILSLLLSNIPDHNKVLGSFDQEIDQFKPQHSKFLEGLYSTPISDEVWTEINDLCQEFPEMCCTVEMSLAKQKSKEAAVTRSLLCEQQALFTLHVIQPLLNFISNDAPLPPPNPTNSPDGDDEILKLLHKAARLQNPAHPDTQLNYIRHYASRTATKPIANPVEVVIRLCHVRFLFQRAVTLSGSAVSADSSSSSLFQRDYMTSLKILSDEWIQWEHLFGSPGSVNRAQKVIQKKFRKLHSTAETYHSSSSVLVAYATEGAAVDVNRLEDHKEHVELPSSAHRKRKADSSDIPKDGSKTDSTNQDIESDSEGVKKRAKKSQEHGIIAETKEQSVSKGSSEMDTEKATSVARSPKAKHGHVLKVGNLEYPAHPFTVRVFNLADSVEDMDLVDLFQNSKSACGRVVHARILRSRHGKSKGWGLVQFEERESVDKALALDGAVGLHEKIVLLQRSHMPAVPSIVPPKMHRVSPEGEGKVSLRNAKRKVQTNPSDDTNISKVDRTETKKKQTPTGGVLSFIPRGIAPKRRLTTPFKKDTGG